MVKNISSFGRNGVHDFLLIRVSGVVIALYALYLFGFYLFSGPITYSVWFHFFDGLFTKTFTMLALIAVLIHAWIGLWQVITDYIKPALIRGTVQCLVIIALFVYLFSGFFILWGGF